MASILLKKLFKLADIIVEPIYYLNQIVVRFKYEDGKYTDEVTGFRYLATNTDTFEQIWVSISGTSPLMQPEELLALQEAGEKVFVQFKNAVLKPYYNYNAKSIEDSITADNISIVETKNK